MEHTSLYQLRETFNEQRILLCFNGPFSQGLIEEIGSALRKYLQSEAAAGSAAIDVFAAYVEISQNIREYCASQKYREVEASATVVVSRDDAGRYVVSAGNVVERGDGEALQGRIDKLKSMDKDELKAAYKERLRQPRDEETRAGLGLIDLSRKASTPITCELHPIENSDRSFFSLRVVI